MALSHPRSSGEPRLLISRSALQFNARLIRKTISPRTKICTVIKADAYGHGAALVADALCNFADSAGRRSVDQLAVATIGEAAALPDVDVPILILRPIENAFLGRQRADLELAIRSGWILTIESLAAADDIARIAIGCGKRAIIHVMLDTGMTRGGCAESELPALIDRIAQHSSLKLAGVYSHFSSSAGINDQLMLQQLARFRAASDSCIAWRTPITRHIASSGAIFFSPASHLDMVRPGIALFGIDPTSRPSMHRALRPVMKWTAPLLNIRDIAAGVGIGYDHAFVATQSMRVALVPVGYADGYMRAFSNRAVMMLHGVACPVVGRVSMDVTAIDISRVNDATIGDEVTVLDNDPLSPASVYELAKIAQTIPYEIFSRIGHRIRRVPVEPANDAPDNQLADSDSLFS